MRIRYDHSQDRLKAWNIKRCREALRDIREEDPVKAKQRHDNVMHRMSCNAQALRLFESLVREYLPDYNCESVFENWKKAKYRRCVLRAAADFFVNFKCTNVFAGKSSNAFNENIEAIAEIAKQRYYNLMAES